MKSKSLCKLLNSTVAAAESYRGLDYETYYTLMRASDLLLIPEKNG